MNPSVPLPAARTGELRDPAGLFAAGRAGDAVERLGQDLVSSGLSPDLIRTEFLAGAGRFVDDLATDQLAREPWLMNLMRRMESGVLTGDDLPAMVRLLYFSGHQRLLAKHTLQFPAYSVFDDFYVNRVGPTGPRTPVRPIVPDRKWQVLGKTIGFPIGVPASVLTGGTPWVQYFGGNGFNVLTYKTVRSQQHSPNPAPHWVVAAGVDSPFDIASGVRSVVAEPPDWASPDVSGISTVNSFGVPSPDPEVWMEDVSRSLTTLAADQLMLVSVMGDDYSGGPPTLEAIARDFARTARMAEEAGASVVELNLSCPNSLDHGTRGVKPPICLDVDVTAAIVEASRRALREDTQLVAKLSYLDDRQLRLLVRRITPFVQGISGINTLQCDVRRRDGLPTFPGRQLAGVSGLAIRRYALDFVTRLSQLRDELGQRFEILAMGGVTDAASCGELFDAGADVVQVASGAFANPYLALDCIEELGSSVLESPPLTAAR